MAADAYQPGMGAVVRRGADLVSSALPFVKGLIKKITGSGDYVIGGKPQYNVLMNDDQVPSFKKSERGAVTVTHREYIKDIVSSVTPNTFQIEQFRIQPGNTSTFPWLSGMAQNFRSYKIEGLVFEFRTMSADAIASTNISLGSVVQAVNYQVIDPPVTAKQVLEQFNGAISAKPSQSSLCAVECSRNDEIVGRLAVRYGGIQPDTDTDLRFSDFANYYIATTGLQGTSVNVGELWVSYSITFFDQVSPSVTLGPSSTSGVAKYSRGPPFIGATWGTPVSTVVESGLSVIFSGNNASINAPVGTHVLVIYQDISSSNNSALNNLDELTAVTGLIVRPAFRFLNTSGWTNGQLFGPQSVPVNTSISAGVYVGAVVVEITNSVNSLYVATNSAVTVKNVIFMVVPASFSTAFTVPL